MFKKILVPTDGSKSSERAGEYAISVADLNSADIVLLNVIDTDYLNALPQRDLSEKIDEGLRDEAKEIVEKFKNMSVVVEKLKTVPSLKREKPPKASDV